MPWSNQGGGPWGSGGGGKGPWGSGQPPSGPTPPDLEACSSAAAPRPRASMSCPSCGGKTDTSDSSFFPFAGGM